VLSRLNQLNDTATRARSSRVQKESLYNQVKAIANGTNPDAIPIIATNANVQTAKSKLVDLQRQKVQLLERYAEKHPKVLDINAQLQDAQRQLDIAIAGAVQSVRNEYETAVIEEQTFAKNLEGAKSEATALNRKGIGYAVIGLVLAVAVALGLDYMNDTIKTPEDITRRLKLPFLGLVPAVRGDKHPLLASSQVPHDFGESFRSLRTSLLSKYPDEGTKIIIVTSAQPLEGKTTTAANIAMALAYGGARVLLVDADMRRPGLHRPLRLTNERGLSQVLTGQARVRDVIQRTVDPNLLAITAGRTPPNPSELLSSERMKTLLANLAHGPFNWIIIDTPPVLAVTDAVILAPIVTGVTFVIGAEMTRRRLAERAIETVMQSRPRYAAVVLNKVNFAKNKYYYSRYYGHQYKNYYAEATL
jgi:capsular exopolysaccharide synthesis family protein